MSADAPNNDDPFPVDDLACDRCGRQLCDGSCPTRDPRPLSYDPIPFRLALTDSDTDSDDRRSGKAPPTAFRKAPASPKSQQLPFETRYFAKPRLSSGETSTTGAAAGIVFFRTQPRTPSADQPDLELGDRFPPLPAPSATTTSAASRRQQQQRRRRQRQRRRVQSDSAMTAAMRTAAAQWSAARDPEAVWYADPLAAERTRRRATNPNGALRSSACRAVQCFLVMAAAMSVIILIAIGATMILAASIG